MKTVNIAARVTYVVGTPIFCKNIMLDCQFFSQIYEVKNVLFVFLQKIGTGNPVLFFGFISTAAGKTFANATSAGKGINIAWHWV